MLTINALCASGEALVCMQCECFSSMRGIPLLLDVVKQIQGRLTTGLE